MSDEVYIISACRAPIGSFMGQFANISVYDLVKPVLQTAVQQAKIQASEISEIYVGNVLTAGKGQNPARQASLNAGFPIEVPAITLNYLCGSGLKAASLGFNAIKAGQAKIVLSAGMENMSQAEHTMPMRNGIKMGNSTLKDSLLNDGLNDAMHHVHMGITVENVAKHYGISREAQDIHALKSQQRAAAAIKAGHFDAEIVGIPVPNSQQLILTDEFPKPNTTLEKLQKLQPAFLKENGTVTAGNAAGINDGAAAVILASGDEVRSRNIKPLVRIVSFAEAGIEPMMMGAAPIQAVRKLLQKVKWSIDDVDLFEIMEAYAAQTIAVQKELGIDEKKLNINGGGIALGHPLGASGARVLVTLIYEMKRLAVKRGVAALCIGGGMAIAIAIENTD